MSTIKQNRIIEKIIFYDVEMYDDRKKSQKKIQAILNAGWKIKSQIMINDKDLSLVFEKEILI